MATLPKTSTPLLDERVVAELLSVKVATVRRWRQYQKGPRFIKVGSAVRYHHDDVTAWLKSRPTGGEVVQEDGAFVQVGRAGIQLGKKTAITNNSVLNRFARICYQWVPVLRKPVLKRDRFLTR
jgi:predicted DNA-binding transcriptional regulator AlpA